MDDLTRTWRDTARDVVTLLVAFAMALLIVLLLAAYVGVIAADAAAPRKGTPEQTIDLDGVTVTCKGNGRSGYRTCDVFIDTTGPARRMDTTFYVDGEWDMDINYSGWAPDRDGPHMVPSPLEDLRAKVTRR